MTNADVARLARPQSLTAALSARVDRPGRLYDLRNPTGLTSGIVLDARAPGFPFCFGAFSAERQSPSLIAHLSLPFADHDDCA
jgi:hypothetical protein